MELPGTLYLVRVGSVSFHASLLKATGQAMSRWTPLQMFLLLSAPPLSKEGFRGS